MTTKKSFGGKAIKGFANRGSTGAILGNNPLDPQLAFGGPDLPPAPPDETDGDGIETHGETPHPGQHAPDEPIDENAHADEPMCDDTPEPAA